LQSTQSRRGTQRVHNRLGAALLSELHNVGALRLRCARRSSSHRVERTCDVILARLEKVSVAIENRHD